jgi:aryl-alcohol dehydrogenase
MKALAAILTEPNKPLDLAEVTVAMPRSDEVIVRMAGVGICHTDLGVIAAPAHGQLPIVLGHEGSGVVEHIGADVTDLAVGDHVVLSYSYCGDCDNCTSGLPMHCRDFLARNMTGTRSDGSSPLAWGGNKVLGSWFGQSSWASHAVTHVHNCVKVPNHLPLEKLGPLGCGIQTGAGAVLNTLDPSPGSSIAVFGVGSVGLSAILAAAVADCATVIAVDIDDTRLKRAIQLGATHTVNSTKTPAVAAIQEVTGGRGARYSVDCIGLPAVVRDALECLQTPGTCATVGFQGLPNIIDIDQGHLLFGKTLIGVIEGDAIPQQFIPRLLELYDAGRFPFHKLIEMFSFTDINHAIDAVHAGTVTKAVLSFPPNGRLDV